MFQHTQRRKTSPLNLRGNPIQRRGILAAGLALSAGGWWSGVSAEADEVLLGDASPADVLAYLYSGNDRFAGGTPMAKHRDIDRVPVIAKLIR